MSERKRSEPADGGESRKEPESGDSSPWSASTGIRSLIILIAVVFAFKQSVLDANNIPSGSMIPTLKIGDYLFVNRMRYSLRVPFLNTELFRLNNPERGDIVTFIPPNDEGKNYVKRVIGIPGDRIRIRVISICNSEIKIKRSAHTEYNCGSAQVQFNRIPVISYVEYKENDQGEWKNFGIEEIDAAPGRALLQDSDDDRVFHPDIFESGLNRPLPVLFREKVGKHEHLFVEMSDPSRADGMCPTIETTGCLVPAEHYFVMGDNRDDSKDSRFPEVGYIGRERILGKTLVIYFSINWRDRICSAFMQNYYDRDDGLRLDDFPLEEQRKHCSPMDQIAGSEGISGYVVRTILYRIPRMSVRWKRIGTLLE